MRIHGALVREQGVDFAIVVVKPHVLSNSSQAGDSISAFESFFGVPVVLMAQNTRGVPTYCGRDDIVRFLSHVPLAAIPWKEYWIS